MPIKRLCLLKKARNILKILDLVFRNQGLDTLESISVATVTANLSNTHTELKQIQEEANIIRETNHDTL